MTALPAEEERIQPLSRFSTSTSLRMALDGHKPVVPMPRWSSIIGCARAVVAILVLAFAAAATGIWGIAPGFGLALATVCTLGEPLLLIRR